MLGVLRGIGSALRAEMARGIGTEALERGASGDRTYAVDKVAEETVIKGLEKSGLPLTVISEEAGIVKLGGGGTRVLLDPVDGSKNSVTGIPFFCTSIAVARGDTIGDVYTAYIINLVNGDEFWAERGRGAFVNGKPIDTQRDDLLRCIIYEAQSPGRDIPRVVPLLSGFRRARCMGAVALDLALLARGAASVFVNPAPSRSFDFAAGWLLVREADGVFTDLEGRGVEGVELGLGRSVPLLASANAALHAKALSLLS